MLSVHKGYDPDYLTEAVAKGREGYYTGAVDAGEPPGLWHGAGAEALGLSGEVDAEVMKALYTFHLDPRDPASRDRATWDKVIRKEPEGFTLLGNRLRNYRKAGEIYAQLLEAHPQAGPEQRAELRRQAGASARQSVAFWDATLSPPKSMTVTWVAFERAANDARAAGDHAAAAFWQRRAEVMEQALLVGHRAMLDFYADKAGYARAGHHGDGRPGQWVDAHQLVAAQFLQHDSRDKDPQLHVHGPILNKVLCSDGKWRAIDGTLITRWKDAASALGDRVTEAYVHQQLGLLWRTTPDGTAREIVGVDTESIGLFSKRRAAITPAAEALIAQFRAEVGREPSGKERKELCEQATLATRRGKSFGGETREGQIARWAGEHSTKLGVELGEVARTVLAQDASQPDTWSERDVILRALASLAEHTASFNRSQLMRAISDALPGNLGLPPEQVRDQLEGLTDKALQMTRLLNPQAGAAGLADKYYRADGSSVFVKPGTERYATDEQLLGEAELRAAAVRRGALRWTVEQADGVIARFARGGRTLGADQAAALKGILTSGAAVEVLAAPAGTGKSFLVGTLAETWPQTGRRSPTPGDAPPDAGGPGDTLGGPRVFGVAYGQRQAEVLAEEGVTARNITAWLDGQARLDTGRGQPGDERFRLRRGDLLVVDEAGAADTSSLVAIQRRCHAAGAKLLLVGDSRQIRAVGPSGALADIAERAITYELAEVRRFTEEWEGPASLRLRDGDVTVVDEYAKHGRLVAAGTAEQAEAEAARAWLADTLAGRDALIVVGTNQAADRVCAGLRAELVRLGRVEEVGVPLGKQGTVAGVGDLVQARRNAWHLEGWSGNTSAPINRLTYRVLGRHRDGGGLTVARVTGRDADGAEQLAEPIELPAAYVREHVSLAYASTVHAAHGRTVDAGYAVVGAGTDAATAYTELTRGRDTNIGFVVTRKVAEDAETGETHSVVERTAAAVVADIIRPQQEERNRTALAEAEAAAEAARATGTHVDPLIEVIGEAIAGRASTTLDRLTATGALPEHHREALAADPARPALEQLLRRAELAGHDPEVLLCEAVGERALPDEGSPAQILHWRLRQRLGDDRPRPRIASYADLLPRKVPEQSRPGLEALAAAADARRVELGARIAGEAPQWAREALGPVPEDPDQRAEWERRAGWAGSYRELAGHTDGADPLGAAPPPGLAEKHALFQVAHDALDLPDAGAEEETMSEGRLRARVAAYRREEAWAPRYVADELEATHDELRRARTDATVWAARAEAAGDPLARDQLAAAAEQARRRVEELAPQVDQLRRADEARTQWLVETAITRDKNERARVALGLRGIDPDDPVERVTSAEWRQAHLAEQADADRHREIREEYELAEDIEREQLADVDEPAGVLGNEVVPTVEVADIRETSVADPSEHADPDQRRRVPLPDETAATVARAERALSEIEARAQAEARALTDLDDHATEDDELVEPTYWRRRGERDEHAAEDTDQNSGEDTDVHVDRDIRGDAAGGELGS